MQILFEAIAIEAADVTAGDVAVVELRLVVHRVLHRRILPLGGGDGLCGRRFVLGAAGGEAHNAERRTQSEDTEGAASVNRASAFALRSAFFVLRFHHFTSAAYSTV